MGCGPSRAARRVWVAIAAEMAADTERVAAAARGQLRGGRGPRSLLQRELALVDRVCRALAFVGGVGRTAHRRQRLAPRPSGASRATNTTLRSSQLCREVGPVCSLGRRRLCAGAFCFYDRGGTCYLTLLARAASTMAPRDLPQARGRSTAGSSVAPLIVNPHIFHWYDTRYSTKLTSGSASTAG